MVGPITIFEGSNYAGDAVIQGLQPMKTLTCPTPSTWHRVDPAS